MFVYCVIFCTYKSNNKYNNQLYSDSKYYDYLMKNKYKNEIAELHNNGDSIVMSFTRFIFTWHPALPSVYKTF